MADKVPVPSSSGVDTSGERSHEVGESYSQGTVLLHYGNVILSWFRGGEGVLLEEK